MPEYSTPTLTPAGTSKLTGMNGSSAGNFLVSDILDIIRNTFGQANGVATLDGSGKLPTAQLPDIADDVLVYASKALLPAQGVEAKIYITTDDNVLYRWDATLDDYVQLSVDLSDYATLDDLAAEESARETADTNLNNALTAIDHRVENLEQAKGSYVVQNYKDGSITPSGKGKWCVVEGVEGVSRVENNLSDIADGSSGTGNTIGTHFTTFQYNHFYLFALRATFPSQPTSGGGSASPSTPIYLGFWNNALTSFQRHPFAYQSSGNYAFVGSGASLDGNLTDGSSAKVVLQTFPNTGELCTFADVLITDLNVYFGTSDLSFLGATDSAKLATIQTYYPHLLLPSEHGTRIVDSSYSGVRAWARNIFDEQTESGKYSSTDGSKEIDHNRIRCVNPLPVTANTEYYIKIGNYAGNYCAVFEYDADGNFIQMITPNASTHLFTTSGNCRYITFFLSDLYGTTYKDDVCINVSDSQNGTYTPYHAPSTLSLTFTGKSAGSVYDSCEPNVEVEGVAKKRTTERVGSVDLGTPDWTKYQNRFYATISDAYSSSDNTTDLLCEKYIPKADDSQGYMWLYNGRIYIHDENYANEFVFKTAMDGVVLYYPLADPVVTLSDPIIDNTLLTESGGRMATVQTGTVVDGSFDMGFITL